MNSMDFEILRQKIENATKKAFIEMFENYGVDEIYGFALYSDEGAMTVCPSTNTLKYFLNIHKDEDSIAYYKFAPSEWKYEMQGANKEFKEISNQLYNEAIKSGDDEKIFNKFQEQLFNVCVEVLEKLKNENFFKNIIGKDIFLIFTVSDYDFEEKEGFKEILTRSNDNEYVTEYLNWMKTWRS